MYKKKIPILCLTLILFLTSIPSFVFAELSDAFLDATDTTIEEMAEEELYGEEPEAETENS